MVVRYEPPRHREWRDRRNDANRSMVGQLQSTLTFPLPAVPDALEERLTGADGFGTFRVDLGDIILGNTMPRSLALTINV